MSKTIIVPLIPPRLDAARISEQALPVARALAARRDAHVVLVSVIEVPREYATLASAFGVEPSVGNSWMEERREYLESVAATFPEGRTTVAVRVGDPASELLELAREQDEPVMVMTTHARAGLSRAILGSVTFRVVHEGEWPTIVVPVGSDVSSTGTAQLLRILVPLDGSGFGEDALAQIQEVLGPEGLEVHLLHVVEPLADHMGFAAQEYLRVARDWAAEYLAGITERLSAQGIVAYAQVRTGRAAEEIQRAAQELGADLIVMATRGRSGLKRLVFGSVTERVLAEIRVPLFLHPPTAAEVARERATAAPTATDVGPRIVSEVMHPATMAVREAATLEEAARVMREHGVDLLPVVDWRGRLVGVVQQSDLAATPGAEESE